MSMSTTVAVMMVVSVVVPVSLLPRVRPRVVCRMADLYVRIVAYGFSMMSTGTTMASVGISVVMMM